MKKRSCREKTVVITGASSGIGFCCAKRFLEQGYRVIAGARRLEKMHALKALGALTLKLDISVEESCRAFVQQALEESDRVDILVNCAGFGALGPVEEVPIEDAKRQMEVNLFGAVRMIRLFLPVMRRQRAGRILNVSSAGGRAVTFLGGWYHSSKFALEGLSDALRMELKPFGIQVSLIEPGAVKSDWGEIAADHLKKAGAGSPYEKDCDCAAGAYREVYRHARFLTSPEKAARVIEKAASSKRMRPRYLFGFGARGLVVMKALLPTCAYDAVMRKLFSFAPTGNERS